MTSVYIRDTRQVPVLEELIAERRAKGLDRLDEVWEGVLHMSPPPHRIHGTTAARLTNVLCEQCRRHGLGDVVLEAGLREPGSGEKNFRVPDMTVARPDRARTDGGWFEGGLSLVVEIRSPREEVAQKLDFYAARGVEEVLYLNPQTFDFDLYRLAGAKYVAVSADASGACEARSVALRFRRVERDGKASLEIEDARGGGPLPPI